MRAARLLFCLSLTVSINDQEARLHRAFVLGASVDSLLPLFASDCQRVERHHYTGKMAEPFTDQVQVDCFGIEVLGARRKAEFMFNDGPLGHLWVLLKADERSVVHASLQRMFGPVIFTSKDYDVYASGRVALRREPFEILIANAQIIRELTGYTAPQ